MLCSVAFTKSHGVDTLRWPCWASPYEALELRVGKKADNRLWQVIGSWPRHRWGQGQRQWFQSFTWNQLELQP